MAGSLPQTVGDEEKVSRVIFSPSYIYNGRVAPTAFRWYILPSGDVEDYISVLRGNPTGLDTETKHFKPRIEGDVRYGYALLVVGSIREIPKDNDVGYDIKVDVLPFPSKRHPNHAGIAVEIEGKMVTALPPLSPEIMMIQKELALRCSEIVRF